ncbi:MAG: hypothetical protein ACE5FU_01295, partial [Nitrospinota bacterium]
DSLDKKQYLTENRLNELSKKLDILMGKVIPEASRSMTDNQYPIDHIKLPGGQVITAAEVKNPVKALTLKDGRKIYYNKNNELVEEDQFGNVINHGDRRLATDGTQVFIDGEPVGEIESYELSEGVDSEGNVYYQTPDGNIVRVRGGVPTLLGKGKILVKDGKLEIEAGGTVIPVGDSGPLKTKNGSSYYINEKGQIVEKLKDGTTINHGTGELVINDQGELFIESSDGTKKRLGTLKNLRKAIKTKDGRKIYENDNGEIIEVRTDGKVINHGKGRVTTDKDGNVIIETKDGKKINAGKFKSEINVISTSEGDLLLTGSPDTSLVSKYRKQKKIKGQGVQIVNIASKTPHNLTPKEIVHTDDGYSYTVTDSGEVIETDPQNRSRSLGKAKAFINGTKILIPGGNDKSRVIEKTVNGIIKNRAGVPTSLTHKILNAARRVGPGELVYTVLKHTYFMLNDGVVVKIDQKNNVKKFPGALYINKGFLFIIHKDDIEIEKIVYQNLKDKHILTTKNGNRYYSKNGKVYQEKDNRLTPVNSFKIKGDDVFINGKYAGELKELSPTKQIGKTEKYSIEQTTQLPRISARLLPDNTLSMQIGTKNILEKQEPEKLKKSVFKSKFSRLKEKIDPAPPPEQPKKERSVSPVSDGEISFDFTAEEEVTGEEDEDFFTIPMLSIVMADMRFGAIAPTEESQQAKVSFDLKKDLVLKSGETVPLKGGGVRGYVKGEYNSDRGVFSTDRITFYSSERDAYYEGEFKARVISAEDYINGLEGDAISKQDKVLLQVLQGELISGFSEFIKTVNNPFSALQGEQAFSMKDALSGSALTGIGNAGKKWVDFTVDNAKKLLPVIALYPGQLMLLEVWETTKVKKI